MADAQGLLAASRGPGALAGARALADRPVALALLCLAWILPGLLGHEPWKPDEAYSFGLVLDILKSGDWVVPTLAGEPFVEKPPLFYATAAVLAKAFSPWLPLHDAARLASGFYVGLALLFTALTGRELWGRGGLAAVILAGCVGLAASAHLMVTDTALLAGFAVAIYGLALSARRPALAGLWLGTGAGIGFMSKGLIAPGVMGLVALVLPVLFRNWRSQAYALCLAVALLAALPWLLIWPAVLYSRSQDLFLQWLWRQNLGRFLGFSGLGPSNDVHGYYLRILPWFAWPALPLALWALWRGGMELLRGREAELLLVTTAAMLAVLSAASDARELYALPVLIPLSVMAAAGVETLPRPAVVTFSRLSLALFGLVAASLWLGWTAMLTGHPAPLAAWVLSKQPGYEPALGLTSLAAALAGTVGWGWLAVGPIWDGRAAVIHWTAGLALAWGLANTLWLPFLDTGKSYRGMMTELSDHLPPQHGCVASQGLGEPQRALLEYYAGLVTRRVELTGRIDCDVLLVQGLARTAQPAPGGEWGGEWRKRWEGSRPGDDVERYWLFQCAGAG